MNKETIKFIFCVLLVLAIIFTWRYITYPHCRECGKLTTGFKNQILIEDSEFTLESKEYCRKCAYEKFGKLVLIPNVVE